MKLYTFIFLFLSHVLSAQQLPDLCHRWEALAPDSVPPGTVELPVTSLEFSRDSTHIAYIFPNIERKGIFSYDAANKRINCRYGNNGQAIFGIVAIQQNMMVLSFDYRGKTIEQIFIVNDPAPVSAGVTYSENDHLFTVFIPDKWEIDDPSPSLYLGARTINAADTIILGLLMRIDTSDMSTEHFIHKTLSALNLDSRNIIKSGPFNTSTLEGKYFLMRDSEASYKMYIIHTRKAKVVIIGFTNAPIKEAELTFDAIALSFTPVKIK